jgi:hypothetical protein
MTYFSYAQMIPMTVPYLKLDLVLPGIAEVGHGPLSFFSVSNAEQPESP